MAVASSAFRTLADCGSFSIVWMISFKFWETIKQLTLYVRIIDPNSATPDQTNQKIEKRIDIDKKHKFNR